MKALKRIIGISLSLNLIVSSLLFYFFAAAIPVKVYAQEQCSAPSGPSSNLTARVGGVALDQAAKFLADMSDITGAYYDSTKDRIVFVGKKNAELPKFDKDDLAVAIKAVIFNKTIPAVSMERDPENPTGPNNKVFYYGGIEDTRFGKVLVDADYKMKLYQIGYDSGGNKITSNVPGYKSVSDMFMENGPNPIDYHGSSSRWWITPQLITLKKDDAASAFIFETVKMQVKTEVTGLNNDPAWNKAAQDFATHHTNHFDEFAQESPIYSDTKKLGQIVAVIKWLSDEGIATDFHWARDYAPKVVSTPRYIPKVVSPWVGPDGYGFVYQFVGGVDYYTDNDYKDDSLGESAGIKNSSQTVPTTKEDIHWTFSKDGQNYEAVAVTADAFRSLGSYNTSQVDFSIPVSGDLSLTFQRIYSSYSGGQYGVGRGWNIFPAMLMETAVGESSCSSGTPAALGFQSQTGGWESFVYSCTSGYIPEDSSYHSKIIRNGDGTFTVTLKDQTQFIFNAQYKLISVKDKVGAAINYAYDSSGKLTSIADTKSHQLTFTYDSNNLISETADWLGRKITYTYDDQGNLLTTTDPNGNTTKYEYDQNFKLVKITDRNDQIILTNSYTDEAKLATQKDATQLTRTHNYDEVQRIITVTDDLNRINKTAYDGKGRILQTIDPLQQSVKYTYGTEFSPLTVTDKRNNKIINTYDTQGNLKTITYPDLKKVTFTYDDKNRIKQADDERYSPTKITRYTYNLNGTLAQIDESGKITKFTYDTSGELLTRIDPALKQTIWTRDTLGNMLTEKDPNTNTTTFEYDLVGRLLKRIDAELKSLSFTYDGNGNLLTQTDAVGVTTNQYDKENRLVKTVYHDGTDTDYTYNLANSLTTVTDALNSLTTYGYDSYQNLITRKDALDRETTYKYDELDRQTESKTPKGMVAKMEFDQNGNISKMTNPAGTTFTYEYDALNRLVKKTISDGSSVTFEYDNRGNMTKMIDKHGISQFTYNTFDETTKSTNPFGSALTYEYNPSGTVKKISYPNGKAVSYIYDNKHRLIEVKDWNYKSTKYTYFKNDLVATRTYPNTIVTSYAYDSANRLTSIVHKKGTTTVAKHTYERDKMGNIIKVFEEGSFISAPSKINPQPGDPPMPTPIPVAEGPDLVITNLRIDPAEPVGGADRDESTVTLYVTVKNQGTKTAYSPAVKFTDNLDMEELPTYITPIVYFDNLDISLAAGEEKVFQYPTEVSKRLGQHTIWAMVDRTNLIAETNENNNAAGPLTFTVVPATGTPAPTQAVSPTPTPTLTPTPTSTPVVTATPAPTPTPTPGAGAKPDLVVSSITLSIPNPAVGQNFDVIVKVKNIGTLSTASTTRLGIYYDRPSAPDPASYDDGENYYDPIAPNQEITLIETLTDFSTSGAHNIWAYVDRGYSIAELNENNNLFGPYNVTVATTGNFFPTIAGLLDLNSLIFPRAYAQTASLITTFQYDLIGRLTQAIYPNNGKYVYQYDKVGNITKKTQDLTDSYYYLDEDDKLKQAGEVLYYYDKNGNMIRKAEGFIEDSLFTFDKENRLIDYLSFNDLEYVFNYDGLGNRIERFMRSDGGETSGLARYVHDTTGEISRLMAQTATNPNSVSSYYIYGLTQLSQGSSSSSSRNYYLEDGMGNVRFLTSSSGSRRSYMDYDPYGNLWRSFADSSSEFTFKGEPEMDLSDPLFYMRARYYDPVTGRFISRDPVSGLKTMPQTQNPYSYAINNPINFSDPSGEQFKEGLEANLPTFIKWGQSAIQFCLKIINNPKTSQVVSSVNSNKINHILQEEHAWGKVVSDPNDWNQVSQVINKVVSSGNSNPGATPNNITKSLQIGKEWVEVNLYTNPSTDVTSVVDAWVKK